MKFEISNTVFHQAILRGAIATQSKDAKNPETNRKQPILRCVKLTADKNGLVVESTSAGTSARTFIDKSDVKVSEEGITCVEVIDMVEDLGKLKFPHTLQVEFDADQIKAEASLLPRLWVKAINGKGREAFAWSYDVHPTRSFPKVAYSDKSAKFSATAENLLKGMAAVEFTKRDDDQHILDNVVVGNFKGVLHLGTTDVKRGAIVKVAGATSNVSDEEMYLVNWEMLNTALKSFEASDVVEFIFEDGFEHLTLRGPNNVTAVRISLPDHSFAAKLGKLFGLMDASSKLSVVVDKDEFLQATMVMFINSPSSAHYHFKSGAEELMIEYSSRHRPAMVGTQKIKTGLKSAMILSVKLFLDVLSKMEGENVIISIADDENRVFVQDSKENPNYFYLMMRKKSEAPEV